MLLWCRDLRMDISFRKASLLLASLAFRTFTATGVELCRSPRYTCTPHVVGKKGGGGNCLNILKARASRWRGLLGW